MTVTVFDSKFKSNVPQVFEIRFASLNLVTSHKIISRDGYGNDKADLHDLKQSILDVKTAGWSSIKIMPLTSEGAKQDCFKRSNFHYRGGKKYITAGKYEEDPNAFVVRGKRLGQTSAHVWKDCDTGERNIRFLSEESNTALTDNQANDLKERFGKTLLDSLTDAVLEEVKKETICYMISYAKQELSEIKERIEDLEKFNG